MVQWVRSLDLTAHTSLSPIWRRFAQPCKLQKGSLDSQPQVIKFTSCLPRAQGLTVIFSHHQVCIKKKKGGHFWGAKSESRVSAPFFASKTVVFVLPKKLMQISMFFADWLVYSGITLVFKFQAVWTTSYHTQFRFIWLNNIDRNKKNRNIILKSRKKVNLNLLH